MTAVLAIAIHVRAEEPELTGLGATARELSNEAIRLAAVHYGNSIVRDLALPVSIEVAVQTAGDDLIAPGMSFAMAIGGEPARLDYRRGRGRVDLLVPDELYRNRALFITPDVVQRVAAEVWPEETVPAEALGKLLELARACVERNLTLDRLRALLRAKNVSDLADPWELLFSLHGEQALRLAAMVAPTRVSQVSKEGPAGTLEARAAALQRRLFEELGVVCPIPEAAGAGSLGASEWQLRLNDLRLPIRSFEPGQDLAHEILAGFETAITAAPLLFFTRAGVQRSLDLLRESEPLLVELVVERFGVNTICHVVAALVQERVAVHSLDRILDALTFARRTYELDTSRFIVFNPDAETPASRLPDVEAEPVAECIRVVRSRLKREITHHYAIERTPSPKLEVHLLHPDLEQRIQIAKKKPLTPGQKGRLIRGFADASPQSGAVVITAVELRDAVRKLIHQELPDVAVLGYDEVSPDCTLQPLDRISVEDLE